jgi:uncharacterized membrane protein
VLLLAMALAAFALVQVQIVGYAFTLAGLSPEWAAGVLLASLVGSLVDIPVASLPPETRELEFRLVPRFGRVYVVPVTVRTAAVIVAVNVGGAVVPVAVSAYLVARTGIWAPALFALSVVALVVYLAARPVPGQGIAVPLLVPAIAAVVTSLVLSPDHDTASLAYVAGTLGTLVGGDLMHLRSVRRLRAPKVSIGGAGTFDGVFLSGVLAVLLGALV